MTGKPDLIAVAALLGLAGLLAAPASSGKPAVAPPRPRPAATTATVPAGCHTAELPPVNAARYQEITLPAPLANQTASAILERLGRPVLFEREGDARKLQFRANGCVLDIYLYPAEASPDPRATFADARRRSDGRNVDKQACLDRIAAERLPGRSCSGSRDSAAAQGRPTR
ncbi:hypothetical protein ACFOD9_07010 [Novosphingobium bradum]|uniref:Uncharacterized protein n=1 Tax=Novosphingobium bradum TaxID=1737444 RepID=A0ABV7IPV5_9SPHN